MLGIAAAIYGGVFHTLTVQEEQTSEFEVLIPQMGADMALPQESSDEPNPFAESDDPAAKIKPQDQPPIPSPSGLSGFVKKKVTQTDWVDKPVSEFQLNLEVTRGGVTLSENQIRQTYSGTPPSLCPT